MFTRLLPESWQPYAKAIAVQTAGLIAIAVQWGSTGEFDRAELVTLIGSIATTFFVYATPNEPA